MGPKTVRAPTAITHIHILPCPALHSIADILHCSGFSFGTYESLSPLSSPPLSPGVVFPLPLTTDILPCPAPHSHHHQSTAILRCICYHSDILPRIPGAVLLGAAFGPRGAPIGAALGAAIGSAVGAALGGSAVPVTSYRVEEGATVGGWPAGWLAGWMHTGGWSTRFGSIPYVGSRGFGRGCISQLRWN